MMMALGLFVFSLRTAAYQELQRVTNWRHPSNSRVGSTPADTGMAYTLIEGTGKIYGLVIIENMEETKTYFFKDGAARKTEFTLTLKIVKEWKPTLIGTLLGMAGGVANRLI